MPEDTRSRDDDAPDLGTASTPLGPARDASSGVSPGDCLGRYTVRFRIGAGGMGEVFAAHDPELDRVLALKMIRPDVGGLSPEARARFQREAQAMARLNHPNVVSVFDVGTVGDRVFVAMELVEGPTLAAWLAERPRGWREVVDVFLQAGRGLLAAHLAGIVHRDFKPSNVILGDRVRVADFGLARTTQEPEESSGPAITPLDAEVTRTGQQLGTPAYMAPEQLAGEPATAASDQYSFGVALHQALHGVRPGEAAQPSRAAVPAWLRAIVAKARAPHPEDRYPSMRELLADLGRDRGRTRLRLIAAALVVAAAGGVVLARQREPACADAAPLIASVWDDAARAAVAAAFRSTGRPYADDTFARVDASLRARQDAWAREHREACEATQVRHEQSDAMLDLRTRCLGRARAEIGALVTLLGKADVGALDRAAQAAARAGDVEACADLAALSAATPPPRDPAVARQVEEGRHELTHLAALRQLGKWKEGLAEARKLVERARSLDYAPLLASAVLQMARFELDAGDDDAGIDGLYEAARVGSEAKDDDVVADADAQLVFALFVRKQRYEGADVAYRMAVAATARAGYTPARLSHLFRWRARLVSRTGDRLSPLLLSQLVVALEESVHGPDSFEVAEALGYLAGMMYRLGLYQEGEPVYERAIATAEKALGAQHPYVAEMLSNHGSGLANASKFDAAARALERALAIYERALGPDDTRVAEVAYNYALAREGQRRLPEARALIDRSIRIDTISLGSEHPMLASRYEVLGWIAHREGKFEEAHVATQRALAIRRKAHGLDDVGTGIGYELDASHLLALGRRAEARTSVDQALAIYKKTVGEEHAYYGSALQVLGRILVADGRPREAVPVYERSLALLEKALGTSSVALSEPLVGLADARLDVGDARGALDAADRAVALAATAPPGELEAAQFRQAEARWALGEDRAGDVARVRAARSKLAALPFPSEDLPRIDRWVTAHGR